MTECEQQIKWTNSPRIFVEITILTITNRHEQEPQQPDVTQPTAMIPNEDIQQLMNRVNQLEKQLQELEKKPVTTGQAAPQRRREPTRSRGNSYDIPHERIRSVLDQAEKAALQKVQSQWANFLEQLKRTNAPAHATIQDSKPAAASNKELVVAFKYEIHCSLFMDHKEIVESILANTLSNHLPIIPVPEQNWLEIREQYLQNQEQTNPQEQQAEQPVVTEAQKLFGEDIVEIED